MNKKGSGYKIAVVGATGNVGRVMLTVLAERGFPAHNICAIASDRSAGGSVSYGDNDVLTVQSLASFDFTQCQLALFSPGGAVSAEYVPKAAATGCIVIDNTSHFRMDDDIPLIVPEVNLASLKDFRKRRIIANPNCSTIQLVMALKPLHDIAPIKRVVVSTYQSVSGAGKEAMDELFDQSKGIFMNTSVRPQKFTKPIAFNVIPVIDQLMADGYTKEEWKMSSEICKILDPKIRLTATCVRVPVFVGHSMAATIEFESAITEKEAIKSLKSAKGITIVGCPGDDIYSTPVDCAGEDPVYVSRIRQDTTVPFGLSLWIVADNLRKGAALNAVQIAEHLIHDYL
ncbi:MAG: aspartate-semialdehyde dehydrogenase [Alphaproteobacteria bacterium]|nr:aspartate-semialdehyde dehydrogenase [Alphaproteobacteria bacterium]